MLEGAVWSLVAVFASSMELDAVTCWDEVAVDGFDLFVGVLKLIGFLLGTKSGSSEIGVLDVEVVADGCP